MRRFNSIFLLAGLLFVSISSEEILARDIKYTVQGLGTGQFGSTSFTNEPFTFSVFANTDNVQPFSNHYAVNNESMTIQVGSITGTGAAGSSYAFDSPLLPDQDSAFAFVQVLVGEFWDAAQIYAHSAALASYDLKTEIGPVNAFGNGLGTTPVYLYLQTDQGFLSMPNTSQVTFRASFVPEPSALSLLAIGAAAFFVRRKLNRN